MPRIIRVYQDHAQKPKIEVTSNAFKITFPNCNTVAEVGVTSNGQKQKVIEYLKTHERITRKEVDTLRVIS